jgi:hypothetical protein
MRSWQLFSWSRRSLPRTQRLITMFETTITGVSNHLDKPPQLLLWAGSLAAREKTTSGLPNLLNCVTCQNVLNKICNKWRRQRFGHPYFINENPLHTRTPYIIYDRLSQHLRLVFSNVSSLGVPELILFLSPHWIPSSAHLIWYLFYVLYEIRYKY